MNIALLIARLLLAGVFIVAGLAKLADRAGSQKALRDFGVPTVLANPFGILLPLAEIAVAIALVPTLSAWWGALGALILLLLFVIGIGFNLARGRKPDCHCFGQLYSAPAGWPTLIRNVLLAAVAGFVVWFGWYNPGLSAVDWLGLLTLTQRIELLVGVIMVLLLFGGGWLLLAIMRQQGRLLLRIEALEEQLAASGTPSSQPTPQVPVAGLPVGTTAPPFALSGLYGETLTLDALRAAEKLVVLLFSDPGCGPCTALMPEVSRWQREYAGKLTLALISGGKVDVNRSKVGEYGITQALLQQDREVAEAYKANGTPSAVLVRSDGTIGSPLAIGADAIRVLVAQAVGLPALRSVPSSSPTSGNAFPMLVPANSNSNGNGNGGAATATPRPSTTPKVGDAAPAFALPSLSGKLVNLSDFRGSKILVLFWNPGCGFCQQMLDDLKAWEANPPKGSPKLLVVTTGAVEENAAMELRSPVLLDKNFAVGPTFGANGTPIAVLVDAQGKIASELAAGAPAVLALARNESLPAPTNGNAANAQGQSASLKVGEAAPSFGLPNLNGKTVNLSDFRGSKILVLFWNPGCGFCQRMLDDLKTWEASPPPGAPKLLVVSTGTAEANNAMGLRSTILLDQNMSAGSKFGANGTPMAVLVDNKGKVASELAVGAPAVLALAGYKSEATSA